MVTGLIAHTNYARQVHSVRFSSNIIDQENYTSAYLERALPTKHNNLAFLVQFALLVLRFVFYPFLFKENEGLRQNAKSAKSPYAPAAKVISETFHF